jgi:peptidoglycan hydrolase-like protein with peptidoglycan-binding domain
MLWLPPGTALNADGAAMSPARFVFWVHWHPYEGGKLRLPNMRIVAVLAVLTLSSPALADMKCVQQGLTDLGFSPGPVDGAIGKRTVDAANLFKANAGLSLETLTTGNSTEWCSAIADFAKSPAAKSISSLDLLSEPDNKLSEKQLQRLWDAYKTAKECSAHPILAKSYPYKLPIQDRDELANASWATPFTATTGAKSCLVFPTRLRPPKPLVAIELDEAYGERVLALDEAATWFRTMTNYFRYSGDPVARELLRKAVVSWAESDALGKGIRVSWGSRPVDYQVIASILSITVAVAAIAPDIGADDRATIGPWLQDLVAQVGRSEWGFRTDNKHLMRTYLTMLWGLVVGDDHPVQEAIFAYKRAIHEMRPDGSWPVDSQRGAMGLHYGSAGTSHLVMIATALKIARNIDLFSYEVDGRSVHTAVDWVVYSIKEPTAANGKYAISCPDGGDRFGSIEKPDMSFVSEAGYLQAYAELFPERESSQFISEKFARSAALDEEKNGGSPACQFGTASGPVDLKPLVMPKGL